MELGDTLGPEIDRVEEVRPAADFVEPAIGEGEVRLDEFDASAFGDRLAAHDLDLTVHLPCRQPLVTSVEELDDALVRYLDRVLAVAAELDARKAVVHADARNPADDRQRAALREQVRNVSALGDVHGVEIVVENLGQLDRGFDLATVGDALADEQASMCFDVGHAHLEVGQDGIESFLSSHADLVSHLHVHDVDEKGRPHVPVGGGVVDYDGVAAVLASFDGTVAIEVFDGLGYSAESARRIRRAFG